MKTNPLIINLCHKPVALGAMLVVFGGMLVAPGAMAQTSAKSTTSSMPDASPLPQVSATPGANAGSTHGASAITVPAPLQSDAAATIQIQPVAPEPIVQAQVAPAMPAQPAVTAPAAPAAPAAATAAPVTTLPAETPPAPKNEIRMNFQGASLTDVLKYLSSAAGFVIVQDTPVTGTVNIMSMQPMSAEEAVAALNSVLVGKGYVAIQDGRILKIVSKTGVSQRPEVPVKVMTNDPGTIPKDDNIVTEIIRVRYVDATKLVDNLRPLLAADASISVNEGGNAILITDTEADIHRMAEIVYALDTSVSSISTIKVYPLRYADAKDFANVLTQLFSPDTSANGQNGGGGPGNFFRQFARGGGGFGGGGGGGGGGGDDSGSGAGESEARKAATRVIAVADTQSNSVVVSAPDEYIPLIDEVVQKLDTSTTDVTQTRIFQLDHADATEVSTILNALYGDPTSLSGSSNRNNQGQNRGGGGGGGGNRGGGNPFGGGQQTSTAATPSARELLQARMVAVADPRTNSVLVNCSADTMIEVATTIGKLDSTDAKRQHVHTIALQHADPDTVAPILRTLFHDTTSTSGTTSTLQNRTTTGVSADIGSALSTTGGGGGGGGGNGRVP